MNFTCIKCGEAYDRMDSYSADTQRSDPDWNPAAERCYTCHLEFCFEMYGGLMEPCIVLNGIEYTANGILPPE